MASTVDSHSEPLVLEDDLPGRPRSRRRLWLDRGLLLVEIAAVLGLAFVLLNGMNLLRSLNAEVSAMLVQPTLTPTPLVSAVILPSGHTPPTEPGGARFNEDEIPEHLRPLVQSLANIPLPTPSPAHASRIQIAAIGVDAPVVQGDGWEQLKKGVGQHIGSPNPGEKGNLVVSAHNDVFGEIFRDLDRLKPGDEVIISTAQQAYVYVVRQTQIVAPTQVEVMAPTQGAVLSLISCYPYMVDNQRIVVVAELQGEK
jgi:sortase A